MKNRILLLTTVIFITFISSTPLSADNAYQKGWKEFFDNNRTEAKKHFIKATEDNQTKADAYLALSILDWNESKIENGFDNIIKFYQASSEPDAYLYGLYTTPYTFATGDVLEKEKVDFLESIVDKTMHGTLKTMVFETLGKHYMGCKDFEKANELFNKTGALRHWQILGTFDNISGSGFDKDWGAINKNQTKDNFINDAEAAINWYSPGLNKADGWFDFTYYFTLNNTIAYAQTFLSSPVAQEVYLRTGTSGSLKIWVNDALIGSVIDERNCDLDVYSYKVKLNKGTNRILLQLGQSEIESLNFMMRVTDIDGNPLAGISDSDQYAKYEKASSKTPSELLPFFPEKYLSDKIKNEPENPINHLVLAETYLRNDKAEEAILLLRELQKKAPNSSFVHYRLAEAYARAKNMTFYTKEIENMKKSDPESIFVLEEKSGEAMSSNKINEVKEISEKIKQLYGENINTRYLDSWIAGKQNDKETEIAIAKANYEKYPYRYGYMQNVFNIEEYSFKNSKAATAIVEEYCSKYFNAGALDLLSNRYIKEGDTEKGLTILRERIERMPYAIGFQNSFARTLYQMQRYQEALDITDQMLKISPYLSNIYFLRGDIYKAMKDNKKAIENYQLTVHYNPSSFEARTQLNQLEGKKEFHELLPKYNLDSLIAIAPTEKDYPDDNSAILLYDTKLMFHPEGATEYYVELAVKILNKTGVEMWKEYSIPYYRNQRLTLDKAEIIKENGQKVKAETNGGYLVFTNLEVGNTIYIEYRIKDYSSDKLSRHFYNQQIFQFAVPTMITSYSILAPKDKKFQHLVSNGKIAPQISNVNDMKLYKWTLTNQSAIRLEPIMSAFADVVPTLAFSSIPDWEYIGNWYRDLTANKFKDDYLLSETMAEILKGKENASDLEKARLFYEYILKNITYSNVPFMQNNFIPQKASRTISTRLGDCKDMSTLFVAMCRKVGIEANLVLILTRDNGRNTMPLPANNFNHCIAQLKVDNKTYYLEMTDNKLPFGAALEVDLNSPILPVPYANEKPLEKALTMQMPFRPSNFLKRVSSVEFSNNDMNMQTSTTRYASSASGFRYSYANLGSEDRLKQMTQIVASDYTTPIKVTDLVFDDLNSLADSAVYSYKIEAKNIVQDLAGMKIFKIKWTDNINSLEELSQETRKYPFELWMMMPEDGCEEIYTITLPEGKSLVEDPKDVHLECANAVYDVTFDLQTPGVIKGKRTFKRKNDLVTPADYEAFRDFMLAVSENDNKQYVIK